jgi:DNA-binding NtrC family response regulator
MPQKQPKNQHRVLVVDDENSVLFTYRMILEEKGYNVATALTSREALDQLDSNSFDIVLCDLSLEQNRSGFEVFQHVRSKRPAVPCVLLTGYANEEAIERAEKDGIAVLFKPIDVKELFKTIEEALRQSHAGKKQASNQQ